MATALQTSACSEVLRPNVTPSTRLPPGYRVEAWSSSRW